MEKLNWSTRFRWFHLKAPWVCWKWCSPVKTSWHERDDVLYRLADLLAFAGSLGSAGPYNVLAIFMALCPSVIPQYGGDILCLLFGSVLAHSAEAIRLRVTPLQVVADLYVIDTIPAMLLNSICVRSRRRSAIFSIGWNLRNVRPLDFRSRTAIGAPVSWHWDLAGSAASLCPWYSRRWVSLLSPCEYSWTRNGQVK